MAGFAKTHHKIPNQRKSGRGPGLEKLPEFGVLLNICATAEGSNFKFGIQLQFAKAHHKTMPRGKKWAWPWAREAPKYLEFPFNISATAMLSS